MSDDQTADRAESLAKPPSRPVPADLLAGLSVAMVLVPQSMAYAELAGLPSHLGLFASALPPILAAFFASSPYLQTGPVALTSLLTFGALAGLAEVDTPDYVAMAALLALLVAIALQVGVNYANDYSDGIRGTDAQRVGPVRLVGQGLAQPADVKRAALLAFLVAAVAGLALVVLSGLWWLLLVGLAAIAAAWTYTGGPRPYGYAGLGEVFVFVFFGLVATAGTTFAAIETVTALCCPAAATICASCW